MEAKKTIEMPIEVAQGVAQLLKVGKQLAAKLSDEEQKQANLKAAVERIVDKLAAEGKLRRDLVPHAKVNWVNEPEKLASVVEYLVENEKKAAPANKKPDSIGKPVVQKTASDATWVSKADQRLAELLAAGA